MVMARMALKSVVDIWINQILIINIEVINSNLNSS
jgi:hypothetical protein